VLALLNERPTHGFALARALAPGGEIGRVWSFRRPLVYRALETLQSLELVRYAKHEPGEHGPARRVLEATPAGRGRVEAWLAEPVEHVRDIRSLLMLKLLFLERAGRDPGELVAAQHEHCRTLADALEGRCRSAEAFDRTLALWRLESTRAALRFLEHAVVKT
jgi:DNA-binding PadR family transcriptional regulator